MHINSINFLYHVLPTSSCGTGYSEPDLFYINYDDDKEEEIFIDIWSTPKEAWFNEFKKELALKFNINDIDNINEAFQMYLKEIET